jgi:Septum formation
VTYQVGTLPSSLDYRRTKAYTLSTVNVVTKVCGEASADAYLGHGDFNPPLRVLHTEYAPTEKQWADGVRWFRCDLGFSDNYTDPELRKLWQPLPADLVAAVERDDMPYRYCSNGTLRGGPNSKGAVTGKCGTGPRWLNTKAVFVAKSAHEAYPGFNAMRQRANLACHMLGSWYTTWAGATDWLNDVEGARRVWCWVRRNGPA